MNNIKLKTILLTSAIVTGTIINNTGVVFADDLNKTDERNDNVDLNQDVNHKSTPVINGIRVNKQLININYSKGVTIVPKYIVIHDTDNRAAGATAMANRNYFANHPNANASAHYVIDDSNIVQALEDTWKGWHVGDGGASSAIQNGNSIGIELAVNAGNNFDKTYKTGIELTRYLMRKYNIPAQNVVMHNHASGKICSRMMIQDRPNMWEEFKSKVAVGMVGEGFINDGKKPIAKGKLVNVSSHLNIRTSPSSTASVLGNVYPNKIMNIYGEENGYYKVDFMGTKKTYGYVSKNYVQIIEGDISDDTNQDDNNVNEGMPINKDGVVVNISEGSALNVRRGPGTSYDVMDRLYKGSKVKVNYEKDGWYNISYADGKFGFVSKTYITFESQGETENKPENKPEEKPEEKPEVKPEEKPETSNPVENTPINREGVIANLSSATSKLNVRSGAGTNFNIQDTLVMNTQVKVNYKTSSGWYNIGYAGKTGFVSADYVKLLEDANVGSINKNGTVTGVSSYLNVRTGPSTSYSIRDKVEKGKVVKVNYEKDGWYNISYDGKIGYVSKSYITLTSTGTGTGGSGSTGNTGGTETPEATKKVGYVQNVSTTLNVRSGAGTNHSVIGTLKAGAKVSVTGESNGWYSIDYNGRKGFVSKSYIRLENDVQESISQKGKVINVETNLNIRAGRGTSYSIIGYLLKDSIVTVLDHSNGWYKIEFEVSGNKKTGYVKDEYIKLL